MKSLLPLLFLLLLILLMLPVTILAPSSLLFFCFKLMKKLVLSFLVKSHDRKSQKAYLWLVSKYQPILVVLLAISMMTPTGSSKIEIVDPRFVLTFIGRFTISKIRGVPGLFFHQVVASCYSSLE
jgi:hypothetical protein